MAAVLILAKNITEANQYARYMEFPRFTYRAVRNAGAIRGVRHAEVHLLDSFLRRPDRHAIMSALRMARTLKVYYVEFHDREVLATGVFKVPAVDPEVTQALEEIVEDQGDGMGPQATIFEALETGEVVPVPAEVLEEGLADWDGNGDNMISEGSPVLPEPKDEPPVRRRRSRCKDCGALHFKDESCEVPEAKSPTDDNFFF